MPSAPESRLTAGTLHYTLPRLLFTIVLFCLAGAVLELVSFLVVPQMLPLFLTSQNASAKIVGLIAGTLPQLLNFFLNPIYSTITDRYRSRWGRRRPFLMATTPLMAVSLALLGWAPTIGGWWGDATLTIGLLALCSLLYNLVFLWPGTVYYYFYGDVLPAAYLGRFVSVFTIITTLGYAGFNYFFLDLTVAHPGPAFTILGILYAVIYFVLCAFCKEGDFPPPEPSPYAGKPLPRKVTSFVSSYLRLLCCHPIYIYLNLAAGCFLACRRCRETYMILFATKSLNLPEKVFGQITGYGFLISIVVALLAGLIIDKLPLLRLLVISLVIDLTVYVWALFCVHTEQQFFWLAFADCTTRALFTLTETPVLFTIFPREKLGQFASATGIIGAAFTMIASGACGIFIDLLPRINYRFLFVWNGLFTGAALVFLYFVHRYWLRCGGPDHYQAPE